ncbi:MAG TPA: hypothetical protein VGG94_05810, partial [Chthoniobacterales bacterium]
MIRIAIFAAVVLICVLHSPPPDPRVLAAMKDAGIDPTKPPPAPGVDLAMATAPDGAYVCPMDKDVRSDSP